LIANRRLNEQNVASQPALLKTEGIRGQENANSALSEVQSCFPAFRATEKIDGQVRAAADFAVFPFQIASFFLADSPAGSFCR
jgi:hypothetical protein